MAFTKRWCSASDHFSRGLLILYLQERKTSSGVSGALLHES